MSYKDQNERQRQMKLAAARSAVDKYDDHMRMCAVFSAYRRDFQAALSKLKVQGDPENKIPYIEAKIQETDDILTYLHLSIEAANVLADLSNALHDVADILEDTSSGLKL